MVCPLPQERLNESVMKPFGGSAVNIPKTSITNLPPEVLAIIFKFAHEGTTPVPLAQGNDIIPTWMRMEGPEGFEQSVMGLVHPSIIEDPGSPTLFPYSLAAVCSFWHDVLCIHPEFWTFVVLFIDSEPTSPVEASVFLNRSQKHHIDVFITRREHLRPTVQPDLHEKCQIAALLRIVKPHLHRCRSLHVDAHLSSSFPIIHEIFDGVVAPHLTSMEFVCDIHAFSDDEDEGISYGEFKPDLTRLVIDGKNFRENNWMDTNMNLKQLTIAHYEPRANDEYCLEDIIQSLRAMRPLTQLKFDGLRFPFRPDYNIPHPILDPLGRIPYIHLQDVSESFIEDFSSVGQYYSIAVLRITRCPLPDLHHSNSYRTSATLILEDIIPEVDLLDAIHSWLGEHLWLDRCHSFSTAFLEALSCRYEPRYSGYPFSNICRLLLNRLPKFSISPLKKFIEHRNRNVRYDDPSWRTTTDLGIVFTHLAVVQCGMGELSTEDENWFRSRLVEFYWIP